MFQKESGSVLLYYFSPSELIAHADAAIQKITETLNVFYASADNLYVIWYHDTRLDEYISSNYPDLWSEYLSLIEKFKKSGCGEFINDSSKEMELVDRCSAYYGSGGFLSTSCSENGNPVMIQDISTRSAFSY
ncbi:MAG: hypothetical protein K5894_06485 [Lachnospiraceae bacterium]|nr:hypothetical protein [Lachnospiraceae bacterium]